MKLFKGLKDKLVSTTKEYLKQRATEKIAKLMLKSRPDAVALLQIISLANDIRRGKK